MKAVPPLARMRLTRFGRSVPVLGSCVVRGGIDIAGAELLQAQAGAQPRGIGWLMRMPHATRRDTALMNEVTPAGGSATVQLCRGARAIASATM